jgi:hypothetical protein
MRKDNVFALKKPESFPKVRPDVRDLWMPDQIRHDRRTLDCPDYYKLTLLNSFSTEDQGTQDEQNSRIALEKMISQAVSQERKRELDLYKRYAHDPEFKRAFDSSIMRLLSIQDISNVVIETTAGGI